jgi:Ca2+-binding EF-hand superfamily protein
MTGYGPTIGRSLSVLTALQSDVRLGANVAEDTIKLLDTDKDGATSLAELQAPLRGTNWNLGASFTTIDADGDGRITSGELATSFAARPSLEQHRQTTREEALAARMAPFDQNGDAALDRDEIGIALGADQEASTHLGTRFAMLDGNSDGRINVTEFGSALRSLWQTALKAYSSR